MKFIEPALRTQLGLGDDIGVLVNTVKEDSIAAQMGLQQWDVILEINQKFIKTIWEFRRLVKESLGRGDLELLIIREGKKQTLNYK